MKHELIALQTQADREATALGIMTVVGLLILLFVLLIRRWAGKPKKPK